MLVNYGPPKRGPHTALGKPSYNYTTAWMHALKLSIEDSLKMAAKMLAKKHSYCTTLCICTKRTHTSSRLLRKQKETEVFPTVIIQMEVIFYNFVLLFLV